MPAQVSELCRTYTHTHTHKRKGKKKTEEMHPRTVPRDREVPDDRGVVDNNTLSLYDHGREGLGHSEHALVVDVEEFLRLLDVSV